MGLEFKDIEKLMKRLEKAEQGTARAIREAAEGKDPLKMKTLREVVNAKR